jgi:hypothetical protein
MIPLAACGDDQSLATGGGEGAQPANNAETDAQTSSTGGSAPGVGTGGTDADPTAADTGGNAATSSSDCSTLWVGTGLPAGWDCPAAEDCVDVDCASELADCYGSGYANADYAGSPCEAHMACVEACNCDSACIETCISQMEQSCSDCQATVRACAEASCADEAVDCAVAALGAGDAGTGGAGSVHTCADLVECCARLTDTAQSNCETVHAAVSDDALCNLAWDNLGC